MRINDMLVILDLRFSGRHTAIFISSRRLVGKTRKQKIIYLADTDIKYRDEATDEVIKAILDELVMNLDQGSIRYIEIKDGDKVLYTESNDEPYND
jgi:hypothetical protein